MDRGGGGREEGECSSARGGFILLAICKSMDWDCNGRTDGKTEREAASGGLLWTGGVKLRAAERHNTAHLGFCRCCATPVEVGSRVGAQCCRTAGGLLLWRQSCPGTNGADSAAARGAPSRSNQQYQWSRGSGYEAITPSTTADAQPPPNPPPKTSGPVHVAPPKGCCPHPLFLLLLHLSRHTSVLRPGSGPLLSPPLPPSQVAPCAHVTPQ